MREQDKKIKNILLLIIVSIILALILSLLITKVVVWYDIPIKLNMWQWFGVVQIAQMILAKKMEELPHWSNALFEGIVTYALIGLVLKVVSFLV